MGDRKRVMVSSSELFSEKDKINAILDEKIPKIDKLQQSIDYYINDNELTGYGYEYSKKYFKDIHIPMIGMFMDCLESLHEANAKIQTDFMNIVGMYTDAEMDTDILYENIDALNENISRLKSERDSIQYASYTNSFDGAESMRKSAIDSINSQIRVCEERIEYLNNIIEQLYEFNATAYEFGSSGASLESASYRIKKFKEMVDNLSLFCMDKNDGREENIFCEYHWKERQDIYNIQSEIESTYSDVIRRRLRTSEGKIDWEEANRIYTSKDDVAKALLLSILCDEYDIVEGQYWPEERTLDSALIYISIIDPSVINDYFSDLVDDSGEFDFDLIGELLQGDADTLSDFEVTKLLASFGGMCDEDKERFIELAYIKNDNSIGSSYVLPFGNSRVVDKYSIGEVFEKLEYKYQYYTYAYIDIYDYDNLDKMGKMKYENVLQGNNILQAIKYADQVWVQRPFIAGTNFVKPEVKEASYMNISISSCEEATGTNANMKLITINGQIDKGIYGDVKNYVSWTLDPLARVDKDFNQTQLLVVPLTEPSKFMALDSYVVCLEDGNSREFSFLDSAVKDGSSFISLGEFGTAKKVYKLTVDGTDYIYDMFYNSDLINGDNIKESVGYEMLYREAQGLYVQGFYDITNNSYDTTGFCFSKEKIITNIATFRAWNEGGKIVDYYDAVQEEYASAVSINNMSDYDEYMEYMLNGKD